MHINDLIVRALLGGYDVSYQRVRIENALSVGISTLSMVVGITPTLTPEVAYPFRRTMTIYNVAGETVYIGNSAVTIDNGMPIPARSPYSLDVKAAVSIYTVAGNTSPIRVLEGG
ncbi:unnamed protein product [marine sediment metagenome]|uniref:Uncharacterized protein n=1 Tax=marine sediment metagenome TaxID=412755 RepID=X1HDF5_9ZZZZ